MSPFDTIGLGIVAFVMVRIFGPISAAIVERIRRGLRAALVSEVDDLRGRLAEVEERLDFAERLLARTREADQLPGGAHP